MAVHGALLAADGAPPRIGYLTSVREVTLHASRLDDVMADLEIEALRHAGDGNNIVYRFTVRADHRELLCGRAAVVLDSGRSVRAPAGGNA